MILIKTFIVAFVLKLFLEMELLEHRINLCFGSLKGLIDVFITLQSVQISLLQLNNFVLVQIHEIHEIV